MGGSPSKTSDIKMLNALTKRKITSTKPLYLSKRKGYNFNNAKYVSAIIHISTYKFENDNIIAELKPGIVFCVDDIIWYCDNLAGVYNYDVWISFIEPINKSNIAYMKTNDTFVSEIYSEENESMDLNKLNKYTNSSKFMFNKNSLGSLIFQVNNDFIYDTLSDADAPKKYNRMKNYKRGICDLLMCNI
jgi:hypothetical protein